MILIFDSYAWIEYFMGTKKGLTVKKLLETAITIYTPSVVLLEIANKYFREGLTKKIVQERIQIIEELSIIEPIETRYLMRLKEARKILGENTKKLKTKRKPSMVDYYILAVALELNAKLVTGDEHFKNLEMVIYLKE